MARMGSGSQEYTQSRLAAALSCFGLMADLYDFGIVNLVRPVLEAEYGVMTPGQDAFITSSALGGAVLGMIGFGATADIIGRRTLFIITATLVGFASVGTACAGPIGFLGLDIYTVLGLWRILMGIGIGGEYPLAAASTMENTDAASSGRALAIVFSGMALGQILAPCVVMLMAGPMGVSLPTLWRLAFGFGAVLALLVAFLRYAHLKETQSWTQAATQTAQEPVQSGVQAQQHPTIEKFHALLTMKWSVAGTVGTWFFYDIVTYGTGLYSTVIFPAEPGLGAAKMVLYINLLSLPGYIGAVFLASRSNMRDMQLFGLSGMVICFAVLAGIYNIVSRSSLTYMAIFAFQRCLDTVGPGVATFTVPGQIYPTRIRATAHGVSAAAGKLGAVVGTVLFPNLMAAGGLRVVMIFMALVSAITAAWTFLFTPVYNADTLDEIASHDSTMSLQDQANKAEIVLFPQFATKEARAAISPGLAIYGSTKGA